MNKDESPTAVAASNDGKLLAAGLQNDKSGRYVINSGNRWDSVRVGEDAPITGLAYLNDNGLLIATPDAVYLHALGAPRRLIPLRN
jgi:hypothetical protein